MPLCALAYAQRVHLVLNFTFLLPVSIILSSPAVRMIAFYPFFPEFLDTFSKTFFYENVIHLFKLNHKNNKRLINKPPQYNIISNILPFFNR